jgi:hypothetical protein
MWTVLRFAGRVTSGAKFATKFHCRCDCGVEKEVFAVCLRSAKPLTGCGCERHKGLIRRNTKHGIYGTPLYWSLLGNKKRALKLRAMPKWADEKKIKKIYQNRPAGHDVDHIVPLQGKTVCGLHWEGNLQYLPSAENQSKKNRYWPDMPEQEAA